MSADFAFSALWVSTILWVLVAALGLVDGYLELRVTRKEYRFIGEFGNGRTIVAKRRHIIAKWLCAFFTAALLVGLVGVVGNLLAPPKQLDTSLMSTLLRFGLVFAIFAAWRAKRNNRILRRETDLLRAGREASEKRYSDLKEIADDTNQRVQDVQDAAALVKARLEGNTVGAALDQSRDTNERVQEMQERGQSDQPEERADRLEGHEHRSDIDARLQADTEKRSQERQDDREERADERQADREERADERREEE